MAAPSSSGSSSAFSTDDGGEWRDASRGVLPPRQAVHPLPPPPPLTLADRLGRALALVAAAGILAAVVGSIGWTLLDPGPDEDPGAAPPPPPPPGVAGAPEAEGAKGVDAGLVIFWAFFPTLFLVAAAFLCLCNGATAQRRAMRSLQRYPAGEMVPPGASGALGRIVGQAVPGEQGVLLAPISGRACL